MKVLVIGAGNMGSAFAKRFTAAGHQVAITSRDKSKAETLAKQVNADIVSGASGTGADVIVLATPYPQAVAALRSIGDITGKIVVDVTNPLSADYMSLTLGHTTSAAETIAAAVPNAHVVKAFNTIFAQVLAEGAEFGNQQKAPVFVATDDARAKATVTTLAQSIGFDVIDAGGLKNARYLEPLAGLNIYLGYGAGRGTNIAPTWIQRAR